MMNCIIVDDYISSAHIINEHLKHFPDLKMLKMFTNSVEALRFIEENKVDLVFLDIDMPSLNGIEFIETLRTKNGKNIPKFI